MSEHRTLREAVEALVDEWDRFAGTTSASWQANGPQKVSVPFALDRLRALLAAHPDTPAPTGQTLTEDVDAILRELPLSDDGTGHIDTCGYTEDAPTCGCGSLRGRLADIVQAAADRARAEAEVRWMKVAVMRDGEAIREAQADAYDKGVEAGQAWGRRVNAPWPRNPYRADALAAEDTPAPEVTVADVARFLARTRSDSEIPRSSEIDTARALLAAYDVRRRAEG